jgi:hypothetical protein
VRGWTTKIGTPTSLGSCWDSGQPQRRIAASYQPRWCTERPLLYLGSFWRPLHRLGTVSFSCCARGWPGSSLHLRDRLRSSRPPSRRLHYTDFVYVKRGAVASSLSPLYSGPYRVISRGEKTFHVDIGGRDEVISADRLKPHLGQAPVQPAEPPRRGRPPASPSGGVGGRGRPPE